MKRWPLAAVALLLGAALGSFATGTFLQGKAAPAPAVPKELTSYRDVVKTVLPDLEPYFEFETSDSPRVLLYGPYAGAMPKGRFVKVFVGCENDTLGASRKVF